MGILTINNTFCGTPYQPVYGLIYKWITTKGTGASSITSSNDWVVPTYTQLTTLVNYVGAINGAKLYDTNYWPTATVTPTNEYFMNVRDGGGRQVENDGNGIFSSMTISSWIHGSTGGGGYASCLRFPSNGVLQAVQFGYDYTGYSVRLLYTGAGTPNTYTGNDGKIYRVVTIGTQTWLADNLCETRLRDNSIIPWYGANPANYFTNAEWAALTTAGCCAYNNDVNNVAPGFTFPS